MSTEKSILTDFENLLKEGEAMCYQTFDEWQDIFSKDPVQAMNDSGDLYCAVAILETTKMVRELIDSLKQEGATDEEVIQKVRETAIKHTVEGVCQKEAIAHKSMSAQHMYDVLVSAWAHVIAFLDENIDAE